VPIFEITPWDSDTTLIGLHVRGVAPAGAALDPADLPAFRRGVQRIMQNAAKRLIRAYHSGYPRVRDTIHQVTRTAESTWSVGVVVQGGFFPLVELDTAPHMPPWGGVPTRANPDPIVSRLHAWLQAERGYPSPPVSAYIVARAIARGRTEHADGRLARREGGVAGTFGRYVLTDRFAREADRITTDVSALLRGLTAPGDEAP